MALFRLEENIEQPLAASNGKTAKIRSKYLMGRFRSGFAFNGCHRDPNLPEDRRDLRLLDGHHDVDHPDGRDHPRDLRHRGKYIRTW